MCVVRGEATTSASNAVAPLSRWLFAFEPPLVLLCFSQLLCVFPNLLHLLLFLHIALGFSLAELRLAVGAGDDDAFPVWLG